MDKQQAEQALSIIREVIDRTREDLVSQNWGTIWLIHAFTNAAAFASIGYFMEARGLPAFWYLLPLAIVAPINLIIVSLLSHRDRGAASFVESQLHGIWITFVVFSIAAAVVLQLDGNQSARLFCPLMALNSGFAFAIMGVIFYRKFFLVAAAFLLVAIICALIGASVQWYVLAIAWWAAMMAPGITLTIERRRRLAEQRQAEIL